MLFYAISYVGRLVCVSLKGRKFIKRICAGTVAAYIDFERDMVDNKQDEKNQRRPAMRLSELSQGTPIRLKAFQNGEKKTEIWGKIRKNSEQRCQIDIYYYEGLNIDLNSPDYDIEAVAFDHGEQKIEWINRAETGNEEKEDRLQEKRESFRIYIGIPVDCQIEGEDSFVLLVDVSEKGFRIVRRESKALRKETQVELHVEDDGLDFILEGAIVWSKQIDDGKIMYGCKLLEEKDSNKLLPYMKVKQKKLLEELTREIER